jgi:hypothetical protein
MIRRNRRLIIDLDQERIVSPRDAEQSAASASVTI